MEKRPEARCRSSRTHESLTAGAGAYYGAVVLFGTLITLFLVPVGYALLDDLRRVASAYRGAPA